MTPLPRNPRIVVLIDPSNGAILKIASNIAPDLDVTVMTSHEGFDAESLGKPFIKSTLNKYIQNLHFH